MVHLLRMRPPGRLPVEVFQARPGGKRPRTDPGPGGEIISLHWERLRMPQSELADVAREREVIAIVILFYLDRNSVQ